MNSCIKRTLLSAGAIDTDEEPSLHDAEVGEDVNLVNKSLFVLLDVGFKIEVDVVQRILLR